jgi:NADH-quinone oxidoreductase E subunit
MTITTEAKEKIEKLIANYPRKDAALLRVLHIVQQDQGFLSPESLALVANLTELPQVQIYEVATFYTLYNKKPVGEYLIQVCTNLSCSLMGADTLVKYLENKLGIRVGETTADNKFTLVTVQCLGSCGTAPMLQINDQYYENLDEAKLEQILASL